MYLSLSADSTGTHSLFTEFHNYEIMFHVSTLLPYTPNNRQQVRDTVEMLWGGGVQKIGKKNFEDPFPGKQIKSPATKKSEGPLSRKKKLLEVTMKKTLFKLSCSPLAIISWPLTQNIGVFAPLWKKGAPVTGLLSYWVAWKCVLWDFTYYETV